MDDVLKVNHGKRVEPRNPPNWQPHVETNGDTAVAVSKGMDDPSPDERELIEGWQLDPDEWMITGPVNCRRWQTYDERWLYYYKANLVRVSGGVERADIDALVKLVDRRKPVKLPDAPNSSGSLVVSMNDWQCLSGDTVVFRRDGSACLLKDHEDAWFTGRKPTRRYVAEGGASVDATDNHPIFTRDRGWVDAGDLRVGDYVASLQEWNVWKGTSRIKKSYRFSERYSTIINVDVKITDDIGALFGYLITDGSIKMKNQSVKFTSTTEAYLDEVERIARDELGCTPTRRLKMSELSSKPGYDMHFAGGGSHGGNPLHQLCKAMEWVDLFPIEVFDWPREAVIKFVNRAFAADGCVTGGRKPQIFLSGKNREIYPRLWQALLLKFGITSSVTTETMHKADGSPTTFHRIIISNGQAQIRKFFDTFGLIYGKEEASQRALDWWDEHQSNGGRGPIRHETFEEVDGEVMRWRRIVRIDDLGEQDVYDVTYEGKGWFIAQGMMVHNCGKGEGGGSAATTEHLLKAFDGVGRRIKDLRKVGRPVESVVLANTGDLVEQVAGHYASQPFTVDLNGREQQRLARHLIYRLIDTVAPLVPSVVVTSVPCNHGENRNGAGKAQTTPDDNLGHVIIESIEEALQHNPDRYGHVEFQYAPEYDLVRDISGVIVATNHGHMIRGSGAGVAVMNKWWTGQIAGHRPVAAADILLTAHRHHLELSEEIGRTVIMAPSVDGGSLWFAATSGKNSPRGMLTVCVGERYDRGWGDLVVL